MGFSCSLYNRIRLWFLTTMVLLLFTLSAAASGSDTLDLRRSDGTSSDTMQSPQLDLSVGPIGQSQQQRDATFYDPRRLTYPMQSDNSAAGNIIDSSIIMENLEIDTALDYSNHDFAGAVIFTNVVFKAPISFRNVHFRKAALFRGATFKESADFTGATFDSIIDFSHSKLYGKFSLSSSQIRGGLSLVETALPDTLDFSYVTVRGTRVDMTLTKPTKTPVASRRVFAKTCLLNLIGTDMSYIKINMNNFALYFPERNVFATDEISDTNIINYDEKISLYETLLGKLRNDGFLESYKILDIEYHRFKYANQGLWDRYIVDNCQFIWWNYGYDQRRVIYWTLALLVFFTFVNLMFYPQLDKSVYSIPFLDYASFARNEDQLYSFRYLVHACAYTGIVFLGIKMDLNKFRNGAARNHPGLFAYLMLIYGIGLVCVGFIVNIIFTG